MLTQLIWPEIRLTDRAGSATITLRACFKCFLWKLLEILEIYLLGKILSSTEANTWPFDWGVVSDIINSPEFSWLKLVSLVIQLCLEEIWKHLHLENNVPHSPSRLSGMINNPGSPSCRPLFVTASYYT